MALVAKVASYAVKYGSKAVSWCWSHKWEIINAGSAAYNMIDSMFG
ncbi:aureocin A53 family class IId bacteriocin [Bacillus paramycoides]|jgi:hypothetical protein|nr:aureocin A53 family class IId bacteriocin [Bacillus paramycoides]